MCQCCASEGRTAAKAAPNFVIFSFLNSLFFQQQLHPDIYVLKKTTRGFHSPACVRSVMCEYEANSCVTEARMAHVLFCPPPPPLSLSVRLLGGLELRALTGRVEDGKKQKRSSQQYHGCSGMLLR